LLAAAAVFLEAVFLTAIACLAGDLAAARLGGIIACLLSYSGRLYVQYHREYAAVLRRPDPW